MITFLKNKLVALIIAIAIVVGGGATIAVAAVANSPENVAGMAIMGVFDDFMERDEIEPIYNMIMGGSIEASMSKATLVDGENEETTDAVLSGKLYFNLGKEAVMLENFNAKLQGLELEGDAYISKDFLYINEEKHLGEAYGVSLKSLSDELKDSIFNPESGSEYALDKETFDSMIELIENIEEINIDKLQKDVEKISDKYVKKFWSIVCDHADFEVETEKLKLHSERKEVRVITVTIDAEDMADIIEDMYKFISKDDSVEKFLDKYEDQLLAFAEDSIDIDKKDSLSDLYKDFIHDLEADVDELVSSAEGQDGEIYFEIITPKLTSKLLSFEMYFAGENYKEKIISLTCGHDGIKNTDKINLEIGGIEYVYDIKENDSKEYRANFSINDEEIFSVTVDKKTDEFEFSMVEDNYGEKYTVSIIGTIVEKMNKVKITVDEIKNTVVYNKFDFITGAYVDVTEETGVKLDLSITIDGNDNMPKAPKKYKKISDITEDDIKALQNIGA